jgi:riboflavin biosynthesis pyrimidine reductase
LVGGGILNNYFYSLNLIDKIVLDIIPVILGDGIKLFEGTETTQLTRYRFEKVNTYPSNRIQVSYSRN